MRFDGILKSWNDDRGFGFIEPTQGGQEIFVHIKAFAGLSGRPLPMQRVTFEVEMIPDGKKRAVRVELVQQRQGPVQHASRSKGLTQWGAASLFALPVFLLFLLIAYVMGKPPNWLAGLYVAASVMTFLAYAIDKSAAQGGGWRTPESTLHLLSLIGGWPGALIAQQTLRHKSIKGEFRAVFWATVLLNLVGLLAISFPLANAFGLA